MRINPVLPVPPSLRRTQPQRPRPRDLADLILNARDAEHARALLYEWVEDGEGYKGKSKRWKNTETGQRKYQPNKPGQGRQKKAPDQAKEPQPEAAQPEAGKKPRQPRAPKVDHAAVGDKIQAMLDKPHEISDEGLNELRTHLGGMTVSQLDELRGRFGVGGAKRGRKAEKVEGVAGHVGGRRQQQPAPTPAPAEAPVEEPDPDGEISMPDDDEPAPAPVPQKPARKPRQARQKPQAAPVEQPAAPARKPIERKPPIRMTPEDVINGGEAEEDGAPAPAPVRDEKADHEARIAAHAERVAREEAAGKKPRKATAGKAAGGRKKPAPAPAPEPEAEPDTIDPNPTPGVPEREAPVVPEPGPTPVPERATGPAQRPAGAVRRAQQTLTGRLNTALPAPRQAQPGVPQRGRRGRPQQHARHDLPDGVELDAGPVGVLVYERDPRKARALLYEWVNKGAIPGTNYFRWVNTATGDRRSQKSMPGTGGGRRGGGSTPAQVRRFMGTKAQRPPASMGNRAVSAEEHLRRILEAPYDAADEAITQLQDRLRRMKPAALLALQRTLEG